MRNADCPALLCGFYVFPKVTRTCEGMKSCQQHLQFDIVKDFNYVKPMYFVGKKALNIPVETRE